MSKRKTVRFVEDVAPTDKTLLRMSKRRRDGNDNGNEGDGDSAYYEIGKKLEPRPGEKQNVGDSKHTLDSDEEEEEKYDRLNVADVEGQEDATLEFDDETKITPFNMNEEMDEGHFDSDGTFIFNKKSEQIRDAWLDNIDWGKIKKDAGDLWQGEGPDAGDQELSRSPTRVDRSDIYQSILQYLQPHETITKALKRLGGSRSTADVRQARWKERKQAKQAEAPVVKKEDEEPSGEEKKPGTSTIDKTPLPPDENTVAVTKLTELVDTLVGEGEFEVYGYTYEKISHELEKTRKQKATKEVKEEPGAANPASKDDDDAALDMFADEIDEKKLQQQEPASTTQPEKAQQEKNDTQASDEVRWEFKWKNEDNAEVFGPCSSQQMQQWTDDGYFKDGVWVRRIGQENAQFYSSKRIDFDLYI